MTRALVLGSAAGGGFPQWNCACATCSAVRRGDEGFTPRTQDSIAVRADATPTWVLVNASPDVLAQIRHTPELWPRGARHSPIGAVVLTNGDLDHVLGLFSLRESQPLALYATRAVLRGLEQNTFLRTLRRFEGQLVVRPLAVGERVALRDAAGESLGLELSAFALPGKPPVHIAQLAPVASSEDNVGVAMGEPGGPTLAYASSCASLDDARALRASLSDHAVLLFDGTFYREDELTRLAEQSGAQLRGARASDMAHLPIDGETGSLARLAHLHRDAATRRIYTHINNTNPILGPSIEQRTVRAAGWEIAFDGMEICI